MVIVLNAKLRSIFDSLVGETEYIILLIPVAKTDMVENIEDQAGMPEFKAYFLRVVGANPVFVRIDLGSVANNTTVGPGVLATDGIGGTGTQIFTVRDENPHILYHVAVRVNSVDANVKIGIENPAAFIVTGLATERQPASDLTDTFGWYPADIVSMEAAIEVPTRVTEQIILKSIAPRFAVRNESGGALSLDFEVLGKAYKVVYITDQERINNLLDESLPIKVNVFTFGATKDFGSGIPEDWPAPIFITAEQYTKIKAKEQIIA